ncbi:hypothetical protein Bca101_059762 [Brassica carinata]
MVFMLKPKKKKTDLNMVMKFQVFIQFLLLLLVCEVSFKRSKYVWWVLFKLRVQVVKLSVLRLLYEK